MCDSPTLAHELVTAANAGVASAHCNRCGGSNLDPEHEGRCGECPDKALACVVESCAREDAGEYALCLDHLDTLIRMSGDKGEADALIDAFEDAVIAVIHEVEHVDGWHAAKRRETAARTALVAALLSTPHRSETPVVEAFPGELALLRELEPLAWGFIKWTRDTALNDGWRVYERATPAEAKRMGELLKKLGGAREDLEAEVKP